MNTVKLNNFFNLKSAYLKTEMSCNNKKQISIFSIQSIVLYLLLLNVFLCTITYSELLQNRFIPRSISFLLFSAIILSFQIIYSFKASNLAISARSIRLYFLAIFLFVASLITSVVFSFDFQISFYGCFTRNIGFIHLSIPAILFFVSYRIFSELPKSEKIFTFGIVILGLLHSFYGLCQAFGWDFLRLGSSIKSIFNIRPNGFSMNPDYYGELLVLLAFPPVGLIIQALLRKRFLSAILPSFAFILVFAALAASMTRSSWLGFLAGALFFSLSLLSLRKKIGLKKIFLVLISTGFLLAVSVTGVIYFVPKYKTFVGKRIESLFTLREYNHYAKTSEKTIPSQRLVLWCDTLRFCKYLLQNHRYTGVGIGNFNKYFLPFASWELRQTTIKHNYDLPHSMPLYMFATCGIIGLLAYLFLAFSAICVSFSGVFYDRLPQDDKVIFSSYAAGILAYLVNLLFFFDDIGTILLFFIYSGILCAIISKHTSVGEQTNSGISENKKSFFAKFADLPFMIPINYRKWLFAGFLGVFAFMSLIGASDYIMRAMADYHYNLGKKALDEKKAGQPTLDAIEKAICEFSKATAFYPKEDYYYVDLLAQKAQKIKFFIDEGKRTEAFAEYREMLDIAEKIEDRVWCPDELYLKIGGAATFLGLLSDSIRAFEESMKWDCFYIEGRYILALQYSALAGFTGDIEALYASFANAAMLCELMKYFPYVKPEYFTLAFRVGLELYEEEKNPIVLEKLAELLFDYSQFAQANNQNDAYFQELLKISEGRQSANLKIRLANLIYRFRAKRIDIEAALQGVNELGIGEEQEKTKKILKEL